MNSMKFRMGLNGLVGGGQQQAANGIGGGFSAFAMAPLFASMAAADSQQQEAQQAAQRALWGSQQRQADAQTENLRAKTAAEQQKAALGDIGEQVKTAYLMRRGSLQDAPAAVNFFRTGQLPEAPIPYQPGGNQAGPGMPLPAYAADPKLAEQVAQTVGLLRGSLGNGGNIDAVAKAGGELQDQDLVRQAANYALFGDDMNMSRINSIRKKETFTPYKAVGDTGTALNEVTGAQGVANQALYALFGDKTNADIGKDKAAAANSYASADQHKAGTAKLQLETTQLREGAGKTKAPPGFRWTADGQSLEAIPGGPADIKAGTEGAKTRQRAEHAVGQAGVVIKAIDDALGKAGFFETGLTGSVLGAVPGTDAYDLRRTVDTVKANVGFDTLQRMREMSPTGGALGQVAVQELNMLQATIGNLDANQSQSVLVDNLRKARTHYENWKQVMQQTAGGSSGGAATAAGAPVKLSAKPAEANVQYQNLPSGAEFIDPQGNRRRKP